MTNEEAQRRFGSRAVINQPAILEVEGERVDGTIRDVGLRGAFFTASPMPQMPNWVGESGRLTRTGGDKGIEVRIVWHRSGGDDPGVGLAFSSQ